MVIRYNRPNGSRWQRQFNNPSAAADYHRKLNGRGDDALRRRFAVEATNWFRGLPKERRRELTNRFKATESKPNWNDWLIGEMRRFHGKPFQGEAAAGLGRSDRPAIP